MDVSVIIATRNRRDTLRGTLESLSRQTLAPSEIIVVDDGSSDGTGAVVTRDFPDIVYLRREQPGGPAAARNIGVRASRSALIAFTDDDCTPPPGWLESHLAYYVDPTVGAVGGPQVPPVPNFYDQVDFVRYADRFYSGVRRVDQLSGWEGLATSNMSVRRAIFDEVGYFDESFRTGADPEFTRRLVRDGGYSLIVDPALAVAHMKSHTLRSYLRTHFHRGCGAVLLDIREGSLTLRRFLPLPNLRLAWREWGTFRRHFGGGLRRFFQFIALTMLVRWVTVAGRAYYYASVGRALRSDPPAAAAASSDFFWQSNPSPTKLRYLDYARGQTALDIGAGRGFYGEALARRGLAVVAVDLESSGHSGAPLVQARLAALPFARPFDTVLAFDVLEHESDEAAALRELRRLTGQRLLISVPNAADRLLHRYNLTYKHHIDKSHQREYDLTNLRRRLEAAGFALLHLQAEHPVSPALLAEFVRPALLQRPARFLLGALHRLRILYRRELMADLYAVAVPRD